MDKEKLGNRIKKARIKCRLTQAQLAEKVDISNVYMSELERGIKAPALPLLIRFSEALNVSLDSLLRDELNGALPVVNNEITEKLATLTPKQRIAVLDLIDTYIRHL